MCFFFVCIYMQQRCCTSCATGRNIVVHLRTILCLSSCTLLCIIETLMLRPMHKEDFMQVVTTDRQRKIRQADLLRQDQEDLKKSEEARKNKGFTQVYPKGWKRIMELSKRNASASGLYAFFAQHIDSSCGAVVCDQQFLANEFGVNRSTISRW